jgi:diaminopimelate decarboxylase
LAVDPPGLFAEAGLVRGPDRVLRFGDLSLEAIARDQGTPVYVYHAWSIRDRFRALTGALERSGIRHRIHYAVKANSNLAVLRLIRETGAGADIVSGGELRRVVAAGFAPDSVVFSGVGKSEAELEAAIAAGIGCIHLESAEELAMLERLAGGRSADRAVRVGIRVNPGVDTDTHPYISTGALGIKFGVATATVPALARRIDANPRLRLTTLAFHVGSQLLDPSPILDGAARLVELMGELRVAGIRTIEILDLGGGLGIGYREGEVADGDQLARRLGALVREIRPEVTIHLEPGRYLTGSCGVLVTRVLYRKHSGGKEFVIVDAAMNDLVRPSHYQAHHEIVEVRAQGRPVRVVDVVGPVCETGDFLAIDRPLAEVERGEYLAVLGAGAYGFVMASNYNSRPRPPEILVDRGRYGVARRRETVEDLLAAEVAEPLG